VHLWIDHDLEQAIDLRTAGLLQARSGSRPVRRVVDEPGPDHVRFERRRRAGCVAAGSFLLTSLSRFRRDSVAFQDGLATSTP
jgi:hypothetical protein